MNTVLAWLEYKFILSPLIRKRREYVCVPVPRSVL